jgi:hypothetical protein
MHNGATHDGKRLADGIFERGFYDDIESGLHLGLHTLT